MKKTTKKSVKQHSNETIGESLRSILGGVGQQTADLGRSAINLDNWDQYLGIADIEEKQKKHAGDLQEGQELNLKDLKRENKEKAHIEPGLEYVREIVHAGERAVRGENQEIEAQLREIMAEVKKLADSSKELQAQFKDVAIEQHVATPGKYHKSFFTWMLSMIRLARQKVEDSGAWLAAMQSKKKSREYGSMAKKHGTTFSLSNERVVATQVG